MQSNEQLKADLVQALWPGYTSFLDVVFALEDLCHKWKVTSDQRIQVIPMVLADRFTEDQLFIKPV